MTAENSSQPIQARRLAYGGGLEVGIELSHREDFDDILHKVQTIEIIPESFFYGKGAEILKKLGDSGNPIIGHCIELSVGSDQDLSQTHLDKVKSILDKVNCVIFSDHICMTSIDGIEIGQLTTLPFTSAVVDIVCKKAEIISRQFKQPLMLENITNRFVYPRNELSETEFLNGITRKSGCGLLLDVTNLYTNSVNFGFDPYAWLDEIDASSVMGIHLAGGIIEEETLYDTHSRPVPKPVWELLRYTLKRATPKVVIVEWDQDMPTTARLISEVHKAEKVSKEVLDPAHVTKRGKTRTDVTKSKKLEDESKAGWEASL